MIYNNIQEFISDLDERIQELEAYNERKVQRQSASVNSSTVSSSSRSDAMRARDKYSRNYDNQLAQYTKEQDNYTKSTQKYVVALQKTMYKYLSPEIKKLQPPVKLTIEHNDDAYYGQTGYYVKLEYHSSKEEHRVYVSPGNTSYAGGFSWSMSIFFARNRNRDTNNPDDPEYIVAKNPRIHSDVLESDDLEAMDLTRKLFFKIDKLNWDQILTEAKSNAPKRKDFGTTLNPGIKDTYSYDQQISRYQIDRTLGTDLWVKVKITRESSYDKWSSRARNAGIHGEGWMKLISMTDIYYTFYFVNYNALRRDSGSIYNIPHVYDKEVMDYVMNDEIRLKKEYIHPVTPLQYKTTAEMIAEYDDEYGSVDDD